MSSEIVSLLIAERDRIQAALDALQGPMKKRGRPKGSKNTPPAWVTGNGATAPASVEAPAKQKRSYSPAQRKAAALRMKKMWRVKRAAAKQAAKG
jgi:hypothetical protein